MDFDWNGLANTALSTLGGLANTALNGAMGGLTGQLQPPPGRMPTQSYTAPPTASLAVPGNSNTMLMVGAGLVVAVLLLKR